MNKAAILFSILSFSGCCATNPTGNISSKYRIDCDTVINAAALYGVELSEAEKNELYDIPVFEVANVETVCGEEGNVGCFCQHVGCEAIYVLDHDYLMASRFCDESSTNPGCWDSQHEIALHEYVHAILTIKNIENKNHSSMFGKIYAKAL
jgi:hypothetical protein